MAHTLASYYSDGDGKKKENRFDLPSRGTDAN